MDNFDTKYSRIFSSTKPKANLRSVIFQVSKFPTPLYLVQLEIKLMAHIIQLCFVTDWPKRFRLKPHL